MLKPQDVTYNGQVIPSSSSVKFLGITFDSPLTFRSHFRTVAAHARHRFLKLNYIFSSTYGPSTSTLIRLYKSYIRSLFDYGAPGTCVASPNAQLSWEKIQTHFFSRALSIPSFIHNDRKRQHAYLPPIHDRNLYLAKRWYRRVMQHNRGVQDYIDSRLYSFLELHNCIYKNQFGFRTNHSTFHALISITEDIRQALDNNYFSCGIFIDLQKGF